MRIISIDPGLGVTGFSVLENKNKKIRLLAYGTIKSPPSFSLPNRLNYLFEETNKILNNFTPKSFAIENSFLSKNFKSILTPFIFNIFIKS